MTRENVAKRLGVLVQREARLALSEDEIRPDPARIAAGWTRRFIADPERAREAVALYGRLGYEVCADPIRAEELPEDCHGCEVVAGQMFRTIYTRRKRSKGE